MDRCMVRRRFGGGERESDRDKMRSYMCLQAKHVFDAELRESERQETGQFRKARRTLR